MSRAIFVLLTLLLTGCSVTPPPSPPPSRAPIPWSRSSILLDFESDSDTLFTPGSVIDHTLSRGDQSSVSAHTQFTIKVSSLLRGRQFPGSWTLLGAYLHVPTSTLLNIRLESSRGVTSSRHMTLPANTWTPACLDITSATLDDDTRLIFEFPSPTPAHLDDVFLADNSLTLVSPSESPTDQGWTVRRQGFSLILDHPGLFHLSLPTEDLDDGFSILEANRLRACLHSPTKTLTIYADGRTIQNGKLESHIARLSPPGPPAQITFPPDEGRLDRNSPGDSDHDGYNESTGSYQLVSSDPRRLHLLITPTSPLFHPILDIRNLAPGSLVVSVEGALITDVLRLPNDHVLILLPLTLERPTEIDIHVR